MKYTLTDSSFTAELDYSSPLTMLKLTKLFIQGELDTEKRNKYIRQYNRLKESGASEMELRQASLNVQKQESAVVKARLGAQRGIMEKIFGNMI